MMNRYKAPLFNLNGFTEAEIVLLHRQLAYACSRLERERSDRLNGPAVLALSRPPRTEGLRVTSKQCFDLARARLLFCLARAIETGEKCGSGWWLDLSSLLGDPALPGFLAYELKRNQGGNRYVLEQQFGEGTTQYLLKAFDVEFRFFESLLAYVEQKSTFSSPSKKLSSGSNFQKKSFWFDFEN